MIGQSKLIARLDRCVESGFPRFSIIYGLTGSGKKTLVQAVAKKLSATLVSVDTKVDSIREVITLSYKQSEPTLYLIADADRMSPAAKNALLKVTEEPPRKAYFVMTLADLSSTLDTLKSRGAVFQMEPYSPVQIEEYIRQKGYEISSQTLEIARSVCQVPAEVDTLLSYYNADDFYKFVKTVAENIGTVNGSNAFKIGLKLKFKEDNDADIGYDVSLFLRTLMSVYCDMLKQTSDTKYFYCVQVVSKYLSQLNTAGINKAATIDMMILELRGLEE